MGRRIPTVLATAAASALIFSACASDPAPAGENNTDQTTAPGGSTDASGTTASSETGGDGEPVAGGTLVIDHSFGLKTVDPGRQFEPTGSIIDKALYDTLLTFEGDDVTTPVPDLASCEMSDDQLVLTCTMQDGKQFSDGSPVTVDDALFSLKRVQGIAGNPSFLLDGVTIDKVDETTLTLTSETPNPALPFILPNPALSVLNAEVVQANGGAEDDSDTAEEWLNSDASGAGSGPYLIDSIDMQSQVRLVANPNYNGPAVAYETIVLRNVPGETQVVNVQAGDSQIALDISPDQAASLDGSDVNVTSGPSPYVFFLFGNQNPEINKITGNPDFLMAMRRGLNYDQLVELGGAGSVQPGGVIPSMFVGALSEDPNNTQDLEAAKAALAKSGYGGEEIPLAFANDLTIQGLSLETLAAAIQAQLKEVGINIKLAPAPVASELDAYRAGTEEIGLWFWGPDYPHPQDYLAFAPGGIVGLRAGWETGVNADIDELTTAAANAGDSDRAAAYEEWQKAMNASGAFVPLLQPAQNVAAAPAISELGLNLLWTIDVAAVK